ncbi:cytochrome c biogenesis protein CcsA [Texcoconibacillus texcoconensis]|uniref:HemX protein n=1 Tax=Texcoconibacillus texcoconensis TaxID=1095777 RepID=A0A840QMU3_9BACI|nr:HemX protein [Texcoconibacillus texcoconensis]
MLLNLIHVFIIVFYCFSVLGYFYDFIQNNQKVNRWSFWLLSIVWILQVTFIILRMLEFDRLPLMTIFEGLFFYSWLLVTFSLVINHLFRVDFLVFFLNVIGFALMAISIFAPAGDISPQLAELLIFELLVIHVVVVLLSYGSFTLSVSFSIMYIVQHQMLKQKKWGKRLGRFDNLTKLERSSFIFTIIGFPLMLTGLILGIVYTWITFDSVPWFDPKVVTSFLVLLVYGGYLFQRVVRGVRGYNLALFNAGAFLVLLINYFLSNAFSDFHLWY